MKLQKDIAADEAEALRQKQEAEAERARIREEKERLLKEQEMAEEKARIEAEKAAQMAEEKAAKEAAAEAAAAKEAAKEAAAKAAAAEEAAREKAAKEAAAKAAAEKEAARQKAAKEAAAKAAAEKAASEVPSDEERGVVAKPPGYNGPSEKFSTKCEHKNKDIGPLQIICKPGQTIHITRAMYGRNDTTTCPKEDPTETNVSDCYNMKRSMKKTVKACEGLRECAIEPKNKVYGDPCPGKHKFLKIYYQCLPKGVEGLPAWPQI